MVFMKRGVWCVRDHRGLRKFETEAEAAEYFTGTVLSVEETEETEEEDES